MRSALEVVQLERRVGSEGVAPDVDVLPAMLLGERDLHDLGECFLVLVVEEPVRVDVDGC